MKLSLLNWIQKWYNEQCNGDWEHQYGILIDTLDNPGWKITINLSDTHFKKYTCKKTKIEREGNNWIHYGTEGNNFEIICGPMNLEEAIKIFKTWIESL